MGCLDYRTRMASLNRVNMPGGVRCVMGMRELGTEVTGEVLPHQQIIVSRWMSFLKSSCYTLTRARNSGLFLCVSPPIFNR